MPSSGLENVVWLSVAGSVAGIIGLTVRAILKSNCKEFVCCFGLIKCFRFERDVYKSHDIEAAIATHSNHSKSNKSNISVDDVVLDSPPPKIAISKSKLESQCSTASIDTTSSEWNVKL